MTQFFYVPIFLVNIRVLMSPFRTLLLPQSMLHTVKLGYNKLGYNEHLVITNTRL
jgi:hypothetical protein